MRYLLITLILFSTLQFPSSLNAQDARQQRRRAFVEDLLKTLIESQLEPKHARPHNHPPGQPQVPPPQIQPTARMIKARQGLAALSQNAEHLIYDLRQAELDNPQVRPLLGDALNVKANIDAVYQKSLRFADIQPIIDDFRIVDRDWRVLNHRLNQLGNLSQSCNKCIREFHEAENGLCGVFEIQPQFDRRAVARLTSEFSNELQHLLQDIYYDCRDEAALPKVMKRGQELYARVNQAAGLIPRAPYDAVVNNFKALAKDWRKFSRSVSRFQSPRLNRDLQHIQSIGARINELLWLPNELDRDYIVHVTNSIGQDVEKLFREITLDQMLKCQRPGAMVAAAREFQNSCTNFVNRVGTGRPIDDLLLDCRSFQLQWEQLQGHLADLTTPRMKRRIGEIENSLGVLQQAFGQGPVIRPMTLVQLSGDLNRLTSELARDVRFRLKARDYGNDFHGNICATADELNRCARLLQQQCIANPNAPAFRDSLNATVKQWNNFKPMMMKCRDEERIELARLRRQIEPVMVKLQLAYVD